LRPFRVRRLPHPRAGRGTKPLGTVRQSRRWDTWEKSGKTRGEFWEQRGPPRGLAGCWRVTAIPSNLRDGAPGTPCSGRYRTSLLPDDPALDRSVAEQSGSSWTCPPATSGRAAGRRQGSTRLSDWPEGRPSRALHGYLPCDAKTPPRSLRVDQPAQASVAMSRRPRKLATLAFHLAGRYRPRRMRLAGLALGPAACRGVWR
jgi:hypothetical protein